MSTHGTPLAFTPKPGPLTPTHPPHPRTSVTARAGETDRAAYLGARTDSCTAGGVQDSGKPVVSAPGARASWQESVEKVRVAALPVDAIVSMHVIELRLVVRQGGQVRSQLQPTTINKPTCDASVQLLWWRKGCRRTAGPPNRPQLIDHRIPIEQLMAQLVRVIKDRSQALCQGAFESGPHRTQRAERTAQAGAQWGGQAGAQLV